MRQVLIVEDDSSMGELLLETLRDHALSPTHVTSVDDALAALERQRFDLVITDLNLSDRAKGEGLRVCQAAVEGDRDVPVVVITAFGSLDTAIQAIRAGAYDFVTKPFELDQLLLTVDRALGLRALRSEVTSLRARVSDIDRVEGLVGDSPVMRALVETMGRFAESDATVILTGESGTGKQIVARALHQRSARAAGPFVTVNVASMTPTMLAAELFGHVEGAFAGAVGKSAGAFANAEGGTLLLDEIGALPVEVQASLLRAIENGTIRPVGADRDVAFDVRLLASTDRDLRDAVDTGEFRGDLYFRLAVLELELPPLRSRGRDVLLLAQHFLAQTSARAGLSAPPMLSAAASQRLLDYPWPGNVRELRNCIERAVTLVRGREIGLEDLPDRVRSYESRHVLVVADDPTELVPLDVVERRYILRVLETVGGNKSTAARILGVGRKTLYRKLARWGVEGAESPEA